MTSTDICNMALARLGEASIADIAGTTPVPVLCTLYYAQTVRSLLREHRWNFAVKRTLLEPTWVTPTFFDTGVDDEFRVTSAAHGLTTGQRVTFAASTNSPLVTGTWRITVVDADTFDLDDSSGAVSIAADADYALAGYFDWTYSILLPTDCLRALEDERELAQIDTQWIIESGRVLTDSVSLEFKYIEDVTTVSRFDCLFVEVLVLRLAIRIETALRGTAAQTGPLAAELLQVTAPLARRIDGNESQARENLMPRQSKFVAARGGTG